MNTQRTTEEDQEQENWVLKVTTGQEGSLHAAKKCWFLSPEPPPVGFPAEGTIALRKVTLRPSLFRSGRQSDKADREQSLECLSKSLLFEE